MSPEQPATIGRIQVLRGATYFVALLVASTATLLAFVDSLSPTVTRIAYTAFGLVIAAVLVLLVHQPIGRMSVLSAILLGLAFIIPETFVHETFNSAQCIGSTTPCDLAPINHPGLRFAIAAVLLFASLVSAAVGLFRSSRLTHTPRSSAPWPRPPPSRSQRRLKSLDRSLSREGR